MKLCSRTGHLRNSPIVATAPKEISDISGRCSDDPIIIYRSADGTKPLIVQLKCTVAKSAVVGYLDREGIVKNDDVSYRKGKREIALKHGNDEKIKLITLLVFL